MELMLLSRHHFASVVNFMHIMSLLVFLLLIEEFHSIGTYILVFSIKARLGVSRSCEEKRK